MNMWLRALLTVALRGPGKGLMLASAVGWILMAWLVTGDRLPHSAVSLDHGDHAVVAISTSLFDLSSHFAALWLTMILAMAPPLLLREIGRLWRTSLHRLRHLTIGWFVCGYVGVWLLAGLALSTVFSWMTGSSERIAIAVALIALWLCSPARQHCLNACHRVPTLRVFGITAQCDALRYGISTGCYCAAACGVVMLLVLLATNNHFIVMGVAAVVTTLERYLPVRRPGWQLPLLRGSIDWFDRGYGDARSFRPAR
jgi:predicted metal-binding membrane protein